VPAGAPRHFDGDHFVLDAIAEPFFRYHRRPAHMAKFLATLIHTKVSIHTIVQ
jgi:hypothetical protein